MKNLEIWEKKSSQTYSDQFARRSFFFCCIPSSRQSVQALLRLLEAIAKSIRHATAMSTILFMEIFQARCDAVLTTSKILMANSSHELWNTPINSKTLFGNKIREVARGNFEAQQQRFLAPSSVATTMQQQQKVTYSAPLLLRDRSSWLNLLGLNNHNCSGLKVKQSHIHQIGKNMRREAGIKSSSPPLSKPDIFHKILVQHFPLPVLPRPDIPVGRRLAHFVEQWKELTDNKCVLSIVRNGFKIPFRSVPPLSIVLINLCQSPSLLLREEITEPLKKWAGERVWNPGTPGFYSWLFLVPKKNGKLHPVIDLSLLNLYIHKQHFKM